MEPECYATLGVGQEDKAERKRNWEKDPCFAPWQCPAGKEETKRLKQGLGAAATGVCGFSVHQREICGVEILPVVRDERKEVTLPNSLKAFMRRVPQQRKFPDIFHVLSHLQDDLAQNTQFHCFLNHWWSETGTSTQSIRLHWEPLSQEEQIFVWTDRNCCLNSK